MSKKTILIDGNDLIAINPTDEERLANSIVLLSLMGAHDSDKHDVEFVIATDQNTEAYNTNLYWQKIGMPEVFGNADISFLKDRVKSWTEAPSEVDLIVGSQEQPAYLNRKNIQCVSVLSIASLVRTAERIAGSNKSEPNDLKQSLEGLMRMYLLGIDIENDTIPPALEKLQDDRLLNRLYDDPDLFFSRVCKNPDVKNLIDAFENATCDDPIIEEIYSDPVISKLKAIFIYAVNEKYTNAEFVNKRNRDIEDLTFDIGHRFCEFNIDDEYDGTQNLDRYCEEEGYYNPCDRHQEMIDKAVTAIRTMVDKEPIKIPPP